MRIGRMNDPAQPLGQEIEYTAKQGFDFVEITLEPPQAGIEQINVPEVRRQLRDLGLAALGHTAYYLPLACPFERVRQAAVEVLKRCLEAFAELQVPTMTVHPDHGVLHGFEVKDILACNLKSFAELVAYGKEVGVAVLLENLDRHLGSAENLRPIFEALPDLGWTLDVAHANLGTPQNRTGELLHHLGSHLRHVHFSDNYGGRDDLHLPLGTGRMLFPPLIRQLQAAGYDGTVTLEVFSRERDYLLLSREKLRQWWDAAAAGDEPDLGSSAEPVEA